MFKKTFKGGVHPPENKKITENCKFENILVPSVCRIPLQQHIGKPAKPIVQVGDIVEEGQLIAEADGFISANIHASIPGKITEIADYPTHASRKGKCIVIEAQGSFNSRKEIQNNWEDKDPKEILSIIRNSGIVGMGGAAFPTDVKLSPPPDKKIEYLIVNGAECEPFLTTDDNLMKMYSEEILDGISILCKILRIEKAIIGIENNKKESFNIIQESIKKKKLAKTVSVKKLKTKYPQGSEKQLIEVLTARQVPSGKLPMETGCVVQNVGTIFAVYEAVVKDKPLYERYVTVTGSAIKKPGNYKIRVGTKIEDVVEECGGFKEEPAKMIMGGPMCGLAISSTEIPVVKGTSGLLFLSEKETSVPQYNACIRCGRCVSACPINLLPYEIANASEVSRFDISDNLNPLDCIQCGACAYICPSKRPVSHFVKLAQNHLRNKK